MQHLKIGKILGYPPIKSPAPKAEVDTRQLISVSVQWPYYESNLWDASYDKKLTL